MLETLVRRHKIALEDYDFKRDIDNRLLMAQFSSTDLSVLEELLYSPITITERKLAKSLGLAEKRIEPSLEKFSSAGLISCEGEMIVIDKERSKYFETHVAKFDPDFKPGM
jgi:predicted transcriptional regulator